MELAARDKLVEKRDYLLRECKDIQIAIAWINISTFCGWYFIALAAPPRSTYSFTTADATPAFETTLWFAPLVLIAVTFGAVIWISEVWRLQRTRIGEFLQHGGAGPLLLSPEVWDEISETTSGIPWLGKTITPRPSTVMRQLEFAAAHWHVLLLLNSNRSRLGNEVIPGQVLLLCQKLLWHIYAFSAAWAFLGFLIASFVSSLHLLSPNIPVASALVPLAFNIGIFLYLTYMYVQYRATWVSIIDFPLE